MRGLQRGAASFGSSTASAALELSNRLVQAIQVSGACCAGREGLPWPPCRPQRSAAGGWVAWVRVPFSEEQSQRGRGRVSGWGPQLGLPGQHGPHSGGQVPPNFVAHWVSAHGQVLKGREGGFLQTGK